MIYTIGHSTRTLEEFLNILKFYQIDIIIDVRHFPKSRHNPQFNKDELEKVLPETGIEYSWIEKLGGFRHGGYIEYTTTQEFHDGVEELLNISKGRVPAIMCAEILWFKCHRRYIADCLKNYGAEVLHIFDINKIQEHEKRTNTIKCDKIKFKLF